MLWPAEKPRVRNRKSFAGKVRKLKFTTQPAGWVFNLKPGGINVISFTCRICNNRITFQGYPPSGQLQPDFCHRSIRRNLFCRPTSSSNHSVDGTFHQRLIHRVLFSSGNDIRLRWFNPNRNPGTLAQEPQVGLEPAGNCSGQRAFILSDIQLRGLGKSCFWLF